MSKQLNELRCAAHEIILELHKKKATGQLQLLYMACSLSLKDLDQPRFRETVQNQLAALGADGRVTDGSGR